MALRGLTALSQMGDVISTSVDCDNGQASVLGMDSVFKSAPANVQQQFQSAHDDIMTQYNNTWYWGIDWVPFNTACGTMQQIGQSADTLTRQIQAAMGQSGTPGGPSTNPGGINFQTVLIVAAVAYVALAALPSILARK